MAVKQQVRVFLSSTFVDMQEERDYLVKKIFPSIKAECSRRGVDFVALDLRWGINEKAAKSGKVVEICMDEIVRSRPFFIGLIGGRYGTVPKEGDESITERLLVKYPWVKECVTQGLSITEMEMQFGVLNNPEPVNAYFFQKNEMTISRRFREKKGSEPAQKLAALKSSVNKAADEGKCSLMTYSSLKTLGQQVYGSMMAKIDELYPKEEVSRYGMSSSRQHEFLDSLRKVYVRYQDEEMKGNVLISGPGGIGKSAYVANRGACGMEPDEYLVYTVVNSNVKTAEQCRRMFLYELSRQVDGLDISGIDAPEENETDLKDIFEKAGFDGKVRWIIDGIDDLAVETECSGAWLNALPSQISELVITATDVLKLNASLLKKFKHHELGFLTSREILDITHMYLKDFSKYLSDVQEFHISNAQILRVPEILIVFLKELVQFGVHEKLDGFLNGYLNVESLEEFHEKILRRLEGDFGYDKMRLLWGALAMCTNGLPEDSLRKLLKVNNIEWVAIYDAVSPFVMSDLGCIRMDDDAMSSAVQKRYEISAMMHDGNLVHKLMRILEVDNKSLIKTAGALMKEDGWVEYIRFKFVTAFNIPLQLHPVFMDILLLERLRSNVMSMLNLAEACGDRKMVMDLLKNYFFVLMAQYSMREFNSLLSWAQTPGFHVADLFSARLMRFNEDLFIYGVNSLLSVFESKERKAEEKRLIRRKISRMLLGKNFKKRLFSAMDDESVSFSSLEEVLDRDDWETYNAQIMPLLLSPFYYMDKSRLNCLADKVARASSCSKDGYLNCFCLFIQAVVFMRLDDPRADQCLAEMMKDPASRALTYHVCLYDIFRAARKSDLDTISAVVKKIEHLNESDQAAWIRIYYFIKAIEIVYKRNSRVLVQSFQEWNCQGEECKENFKSLLNEMAERVPGNSVWALYDVGCLLYNLGKNDFARMAFECSLAYSSESDFMIRVELHRMMGICFTKYRQYHISAIDFRNAFELKKKHLDVNGGTPLETIYYELEHALRVIGDDDASVALSEEMIDLCKDGNRLANLSDLYDKKGLGLYSMLHKPDRTVEQKADCFVKAYDAFLEAERLEADEEARISKSIHRATLVIKAAVLKLDVPMAQVNSCMSFLEDLVEQDGKNPAVKSVAGVLALGYVHLGNWSRVKELKERWGVSAEMAKTYEYHLIYHLSEDKGVALRETAEKLLDKCLGIRDKDDLEEELLKIIDTGILGEFVNKLEEMAEEEPLNAWLMMELGSVSHDDDLKAKGEAMLSSILAHDRDFLKHYEQLGKHVQIDEVLMRNGWSREDIDNKLADLKFRCFIDEDYMVEGAIETVLKAHDALEKIAVMMDSLIVQTAKLEEMCPGEQVNGLYTFGIFPLKDNKETVLKLIDTQPSDVVCRFKDSVHAVISLCSGKDNYEYDSFPRNILDLGRSLGLPCDPQLVWHNMRLANGPDAALALWDEFPDCHGYVRCQLLYVRALRALAKNDEAEAEAVRFLSGTQSDPDLEGLEIQYAMILMSRGRYAEAKAWMESRVEDVQNSHMGHVYHIALAYTGYPSEALRLLEKLWSGSATEYYLKGVYLVMQGLLDDAENVSGQAPEEPEGNWAFVLVMIQTARFYMDMGDIDLARETLDAVREWMADKYLGGMCEYEAEKLGLELESLPANEVI